jgi:regulator of sigma E protease
VLITLIAFIVTILVIITIHELGHFLAARITGMRVKRFSIGFPPKMFSRKIGETEFSISWIPLGGYVQVAGMIDESMEDDALTGAPDEFMSKRPPQKLFFLSAGVIMNYLTAFLIIASLTAVVGIGDVDGTIVGEVLSGMPAMSAGARAGDRIVAVNHQATSQWENVVTRIIQSGDTVLLSVQRPGVGPLDLLIPTQKATDDTTRRMIGIAPKINRRPASLGDAIGQGWEFCASTTIGTARFIGGLFGGTSRFSQLAGPVGVAKMSGESARQGAGAFLFFIAYVSVSIGFLNILPIPALDGGHIIYVLIEAVIRRPIPTNVKLWVQQIGIGLLLLLVLFVSYHDIVRIFS